MNRALALREWAGTILLAVLVASAARASEPAAASPFAGRIETSNLSRRQRSGPDAIGGLGDWTLSNGEICGVVSDPSHESDLSDRGGVLVDLGRCGVADDQFIVLQPLLNLSRDGMLPGDEIRAENGPGEAKLITRAQRDGLLLETGFLVDREQARRLRVVSRLSRVGKGPALHAFGDVAVHSDRALQPFTLSLAAPEKSRGFAHPAVDLDGALSVARAAYAGDLHVLVGADGIEPGVSYGIRLSGARVETASGKSRPASALVLAAPSFSAFAVFSRPFWWKPPQHLGVLQLAQLPLMDLAQGETLVVERELWVGDRSDVASVTDALFADAHGVSGRVSDVSARLHVDREDGVPMTELRAGAGGDFALRLPDGRYRLTARAPGGREQRISFAVLGDDAVLPALDLGGAAELVLPRGFPMRLVFLGAGGTPDPDFGESLLGLRFGAEPPESSLGGRDVHLAGRASDPVRVALAPGRYDVLATRGPEFGITRATVSLAAGERKSLGISPPQRVIETPGWISADFHVHAAPSDDSSLSLERRLASFVADGDEVLVATDHDHVTDYGPLVRELDLAGQIATIVGQEVTSNTRSPAAPYSFGHMNVFPLPFRPELYRKGALPNENRRLRDVLASVQALGGERVAQLNHAREPTPGRSRQAFFTHLSIPGEPYDPTKPLTASPNAVLLEADAGTGLRDLDFDVMELLNGASLARYRLLREDWFSLLRQGVVRPGTANSDTHRFGEVAAAPRNYVRVLHDSPSRFDQAELVQALRAGRLYGTTGPLLDVTLGDAGPGERFAGAAGTLRVRADAAPWVPVSRLRVFVDGSPAAERELAPGVALELPLQFGRDSFVTVEVEGTPDATYAAVLPGFTPFAFSNPIFVDADGDGRWMPEGALAPSADRAGSHEENP